MNEESIPKHKSKEEKEKMGFVDNKGIHLYSQFPHNLLTM